MEIVFSEEELGQHGGLTLTPRGEVVVNPEGEAIFKGKGYFILSGDFTTWGPSLSICFESRQYVTGRSDNIFMMEAHDHFHEGFRQLSIHMPSPSTDYKVKMKCKKTCSKSFVNKRRIRQSYDMIRCALESPHLRNPMRNCERHHITRRKFSRST